MPNSFDTDQDPHSVGPDLDPNCLQRLSAEDKSHLQQEKINMDEQPQSTLFITLSPLIV